MRYRREIDGLRSIAVLPVILYHAGFRSLFAGGYVGVDIFFVISGYLITSILVTELELGKFSIINFYERRARRILPALFFVLLACLPFAWLWLVPLAFKTFCQNLIAVSLFSSNVLFWRTNNYFDGAAEFNPLLHTWSLGVEEQFYIFFPLFLALAWRFGKRATVYGVVATLIVSLYLAQHFVGSNPAASFFLLPMRGWELSIGSLVAFVFSFREEQAFKKNIAEIGSLAGFAMVAAAIFLFDEKTPIPSLVTLLPTVGAGLIILFANGDTLVGRLLGTKVLVGIGLVSYSAYLWHQPIFAFARHFTLGDVNTATFWGLILVTFVLAYISWRFVESPFRAKNSVSRRSIFMLSIAGILFFSAVGLAGYKYGSAFNRIPADRADYIDYFDNAMPDMRYVEREHLAAEFRFQCDFMDFQQARRGNNTHVPVEKIADECFVRDRAVPHAVFLWGDSHSRQLYPGLHKELPTDWQILQVTSSGCQANFVAEPNRKKYCDYSNWFAVKTIRETLPDVVVVAQNINHDLNNMVSIAQQLQQLGVRKVLFVGPSPHWNADLPVIVALRLWDNTPARTSLGLNQHEMEIDADLKKHFPESASMRYVSIIDNFCNADGCKLFLTGDRRTGITSNDYGHLTVIASVDFAKNVLVREIVGGN